jgi:hypothetical protein
MLLLSRRVDPWWLRRRDNGRQRDHGSRPIIFASIFLATAPVPPNNPAPNATQSIREKSQQAQISGLEDRIRSGERWMIYLTAAIALFGLCSVGIGILQWRAMKGQLKEMRDGSMDTHTLAQAAKDQAEVTRQYLIPHFHFER